MKNYSQTIPNVFIIESLSLEEEKKGKFEGELISQILNFHDVPSEYHYIRTKEELKEFVNKFENDEYRYLHLSMHGEVNCIRTTFGDPTHYEELGLMLRGALEKKRLFISACSVVNTNLADNVFRPQGCQSIIGHPDKPDIDAAAIFWASFYHLMFKKMYNKAEDKIKYKEIVDILEKLIAVYEIPITYFRYSETDPKHYKIVPLKL